MKRITDPSKQTFQNYDILAVLIVVLMVLANIVSFKLVDFGPFTLRMGVFVAAGSHIMADIFVEVYGFARMRRIAWMNTIAIALTFLVLKCAVLLPGASGWANDEEFNMIFNRDTVTAVTTIFVTFIGQYSNALIMSKMKILTDGKMFWLRALASSFVAGGLISTIFYSFAHVPHMTGSDMIPAIVSSWFVRLGYETFLLPVTYSIVGMLKRIEGVDVFDPQTSFNPFRFSIASPSSSPATPAHATAK